MSAHTVADLFRRGIITTTELLRIALLTLELSHDEADAVLSRLMAVSPDEKSWVPFFEPPRKPRREYRVWTSDEKDRLQRLYEGGMPIPEIAARLGRKPTSVEGQISARRLKRKAQ